MSESNPITSTSCEKMTGTRVHHVEHSKKSRDPSFEHLRIYDRNSPIKKHIPNTLVVVELAAVPTSVLPPVVPGSSSVVVPCEAGEGVHCPSWRSSTTC